MKKLHFIVVMTALAASPSLYGQTEQNHLEFIQNLRAKGYSDLAMEYIQQVEAAATGKFALDLKVETARTLAFMARKRDPDQRVGVLNQARELLDEVLKKDPAAGGKVRLEMAKLTSAQAQAILSKAFREETTADQQREALKAEPLFDQVKSMMDASIKTIADEKEKRQAMFEQANNLMENTKVYIELGREDMNRKRAVLVGNARKLYEKIIEEEKGTYLANLATAYLVKCCQEMQDPTKAAEYYKMSLGLQGPGAEAGQRWARYFRMENNRGKVEVIKADTIQWLKDFPSHHKTPEGYGVRWEQALAHFREAKSQKDQAAKETVKMYEQTQKLLATMNEPDNDYAEMANQLNIQMSLTRVSDKQDIDTLKDFEECYLRAQVELGRARKTGDKLDEAIQKSLDPKKQDPETEKLRKQQKQHLRDVTRALQRGLALADTKVLPSKIEEAKYLLMSVYFTSGDFYRSAILGEDIAKAKPPLKKAPSGAGYAIESYAGLYERDNLEETRIRLKDMLEFVLSPEGQRLWSADRVTGVARFQLAMLLNKDGDYKGAVDQLDKVPSDFPAYIYSQAKLVLIANDASKKSEDAAEKKDFKDIIKKVLDRMPQLPKDSDTFSAELYFHAQLIGAEFQYAEAAELAKDKASYNKALQKYLGMQDSVESLQRELSARKVQSRDDLEFFLGVMKKYSQLGIAGVLYRQGKYDKVIEPGMTGQVVAAVRKEIEKNKVARMRDFEITGEMIGLALRSNVQLGKMDDAKALLKLLENLKPEDGAFQTSGTTNVLRNLVVDLNVQVKELQRLGDKEGLTKTVNNFSSFLDELIKTQGGGKGVLAKNELFFLGQCFESLERFEKAADLYRQYPVPKAVLEKDPKSKFTQDEERELQTHFYVQVKIGGLLRKGKKFEESVKVLDDVLNHKNSRLQLNALFEKNMIYQDKEFWGPAIKGWTEFLKNPAMAPQNRIKTKELKEMYYDAYYHHAVCWYKYSQKPDVPPASREKFLIQAATYIVRLETSVDKEGWSELGPQFQALMTKEKALAEAYKKVKAG